MSRYVSPERRRRRRQVDGPEGDQPAEFEPQRVVRVMRCPSCRSVIGTMRRWRMLCSECGHEWEEENVLTAVDKLADLKTQAAEYAVMGLMWGGLLLCLMLTVGFFLFAGMWFIGGARGLIVGVVLLMMLIAVGGMVRSRNDRLVEYGWWQRGWRDRF